MAATPDDSAPKRRKSTTAPPPPPRTLNVQKLSSSRAAELESLHSIISARVDNDFRSQRNKRRRTNSYLVKKKRGRPRSKGKVEDCDSGEVSNRVKRRRMELKGNWGLGFGRCGDGTKRLRTHVWHAKRFQMVKVWGFVLPLGLHGSGRGSRALLKWYRQGAVVHDASYHSPLQLDGPEDLLLSILSMVLTPSPLTYTEDVLKQLLSGNSYQRAILHHAEDDNQTICPVTYMWRDYHQRPGDISMTDKNHEDNNDLRAGTMIIDEGFTPKRRQLWIWLHPSAFNEGYDAVKSACQKRMDKTGVLVDCVSLEGQLARLEIMGSNAFKILQKILAPVTCFLEDSWQLKKCTTLRKNCNEVRPGVLGKEDCFAPGAVVQLLVADPRTVRHKRSQPDSGPEASTYPNDVLDEEESKGHTALNGNFNATEAMADLQPKAEMGCAVSTMKELWDVKKGIDPPVEENVLCMERHQERLQSFCLKNTAHKNINPSLGVAGSRSCPILLLRNSNQEGFLQGWSIILPLTWVKPFWGPLVSTGAHAIGLREKRWIACDVGLPCFPSDFLDCNAYSAFKDTEAAAPSQKMKLCPPAVRPFKVPTKPPWNTILMKGSHTFDNTDIYRNSQPNASSETGDALVAANCVSSCKLSVARTSDELDEFLHAICGDHLLLFPYGRDHKGVPKGFKDDERITQASKSVILDGSKRRLCYLRVVLQAFREGIIEEGAVISAPQFTDISLWTSSLDVDRAKLHIPNSFVSSYFEEKDTGDWDFRIPEDPAVREAYRWPIGFVTAGFVRGSKKPVAVGQCEAVKLAMLRQEQWSRLPVNKRKKQLYVLVRNLRSTVQRLALATAVLETQREDLDCI
ncbi:hypothetical protein Droror1_Dr00001227 [Drosera rotundifolia]